MVVPAGIPAPGVTVRPRSPATTAGSSTTWASLIVFAVFMVALAVHRELRWEMFGWGGDPNLPVEKVLISTPKKAKRVGKAL